MSERAPPPIVVALVRHGDYHQPEGVPSAHLPHPLTPRGREQARVLGKRLDEEVRHRELEWAPCLHSSSLLRAWETARLAAGELHERHPETSFDVAEFDALAERSIGAANNLHVDAIDALVRADPRHPDLPNGWKSHPTYRLPFIGAESLMQAGVRVASHVEARARALAMRPPADSRGRLQVFIGHGGALRHAAVALGVLELGAVAGLSMHHCGYVLLEREADPAGAPARWRQVGGEWKVRPPRASTD